MEFLAGVPLTSCIELRHLVSKRNIFFVHGIGHSGLKLNACPILGWICTEGPIRNAEQTCMEFT